MSDYSDLTIIIPTLNEKINLKSLLPELFRLYTGCSVFIADDGSDDGTLEMVKNFPERQEPASLILMDRKRKILLPGKDNVFSKTLQKGLAPSVCDAINMVSTEKFAVIDADGQHPVELPGKMYKKLADSDLVCAFRNDYSAMPVFRRILSLTGNYLARISLPQEASAVKDPLSGAFAGVTFLIKKYMPPQESRKGFKILFEILKKADPELKIAQTGYAIRKRKQGKSGLGPEEIKDFFNSLHFKVKAALLSLAGFIFISLLYLIFLMTIRK